MVILSGDQLRDVLCEMVDEPESVLEELFLSGTTMTTSIIPFGGLDHWLVQLEAIFMGIPKNIPFRFENAWLSHPEFNSNIDKWWKEDLNIQGTKMFMLQQKLKHIKGKLKSWKKNEFGNIFKAKREVEQKLREINRINITEGFIEKLETWLAHF